jgi:alpha-tubulin suppressor-like RCC1 family protein
VVAIAGGRDHSLALLSDGTVKAWGLNAAGQLGDGTTTGRTTPVAVSGLSGVVAIATGQDLSLASISTPNNSVNTNGVFGGEVTAQANWMISFLSPNQGIGVG